MSTFLSGYKTGQSVYYWTTIHSTIGLFPQQNVSGGQKSAYS